MFPPFLAGDIVPRGGYLIMVGHGSGGRVVIEAGAASQAKTKQVTVAEPEEKEATLQAGYVFLG